MSERLSDEALTDLLAKAEVALVDESHQPHRFRLAAAMTPEVVLALVREVQAARAMDEEWCEAVRRADARADAAEEYADDVASRLDTVIRENNALRKNNERLTRENAELRDRARRAESANAAAQTMAAHWKLKATGEPLDEKEGVATFSAPMCASCGKDSARCWCGY